jgi:TolB-like protein/class 3 adenylate cyclase
VQAERPSANAAIVQGANRVIIALPQAVNRVESTTTTDTSHPFSRLIQREVWKKSLTEPVRGNLVETVKGPRPRRIWLTSEPQNGLQALAISCRVGLYSIREVPRLEAHSVERKLAAIFAADVEAYSRLMGLDEVGTLCTLTAYRVIVDRLIASHRGRIFNTAGDSILADFASAVDAVQCAVEMQEAIAKANADQSVGEQMRFRIGIRVGDIIVQGDNLFGDAVNIAARLEALAEPGGICVSGTVRDQIGTKLPVSFTDLGEQQVKNIAQPIRAYRIKAGTSPTATPAVGSSLPLPDKPSIAVLPFANMSGDPEQEYFADGMVEEIITALSRIRWLFVIARNSTFTYKGQTIDVKRVGRELGVRYVLEGSVRKAGGRVRITAQLIDAVTGTHLWADRFDGSLEDVFELQDKVALSVGGVIEPTVQAAEIRRSANRPTNDLTAYDLYLRALPHVFSQERVRYAFALDCLGALSELHGDRYWDLQQRSSRHLPIGLRQVGGIPARDGSSTRGSLLPGHCLLECARRIRRRSRSWRLPGLDGCVDSDRGFGGNDGGFRQPAYGNRKPDAGAPLVGQDHRRNSEHRSVVYSCAYCCHVRFHGQRKPGAPGGHLSLRVGDAPAWRAGHRCGDRRGAQVSLYYDLCCACPLVVVAGLERQSRAPECRAGRRSDERSRCLSDLGRLQKG